MNAQPRSESVIRSRAMNSFAIEGGLPGSRDTPAVQVPHVGGRQCASSQAR
jgi:hypothetical protein